MAEIFSSIAQKYRQRLCRIIVKVQKYGCHGLVEPFVLINEISYIQHFIQTINDARLASQNDISEMSSFSLFDGQCCEQDNKINNKEMCADACTEQKEAILNEMINFLSMIDLDISFSSPFCPNFLHVFNAICSVILIINDFSTRSLKNNLPPITEEYKDHLRHLVNLFVSYFRDTGADGKDYFDKHLAELIQLGQAVAQPETDNPKTSVNIPLHYLSEELRKEVTDPSGIATGPGGTQTHEDVKDILAYRKFWNKITNNELDKSDLLAFFNSNPIRVKSARALIHSVLKTPSNPKKQKEADAVNEADFKNSEKYRRFENAIEKNLTDIKHTEAFVNDKLSIYLPCMFYNDEKKILKTFKIYTCFIKFRKYLYAIKIFEHLQKQLTTEPSLSPWRQLNNDGRGGTKYRVVVNPQPLSSLPDTESVLKFTTRYHILMNG